MLKKIKNIGLILFLALSAYQAPLFANQNANASTQTSQSAPANVQKTADQKGLVNINTADAKALQELPGVGPKTAEKIISFRNENGAFKEKKELQNVRGIGPKKYAALENLITV